MHVIYDGRALAYQFTGLGRFAGDLLFALLDTGVSDEINYTVLKWEDGIVAEVNPYYRKLGDYENRGLCKVVSVPCRPISLLQHFCLGRYVNKLSGDAYFYPHFDVPLSVRTPSVSMVHDLFPLKVPGYITRHSKLKILYFNLMLRWIARKSGYIFALSNTSKKDYLSVVGARFEGKVGVSLAGPIVSDSVIEPGFLPGFSVPQKYLLYVGDRRPHKNLRRIIDLFILLKDSGKYAGELLLVGTKTNHDFNVEEHIGSRPDIRITGQVDDATLVYLYRHTDALVFLSKYEGLGLPVLEAGFAGRRMIISDGGALPEFAPAWAFVLPNSAELGAVSEDVMHYLETPPAIDQEYAKKFTWQATAQRVRDQFLRMKRPARG
jgi:glycosyltransferase involved in cell wall biosynthesis